MLAHFVSAKCGAATPLASASLGENANRIFIFLSFGDVVFARLFLGLAYVRFLVYTPRVYGARGLGVRAVVL